MTEFLMSVDMADVVMNLILATAAMAILVSIYRAHRSNGHSKYRNFNLMDLFTTDEGRADRPALQETVVFLVLTWAVITYTVKGELTEWLAGIYVGTFVLRAAHAAYLRSKEAPLANALAAGGEVKTTSTK